MSDNGYVNGYNEEEGVSISPVIVKTIFMQKRRDVRI